MNDGIGFLKQASSRAGGYIGGGLVELAYYADSFRSALTGLGFAGRDTEVAYQPTPGQGILDQHASDLRRMNVYAQRLVEELVEDSLKKGWIIQDADETALEEVYDLFDIRSKVQEAGELGRQFGGGFLWLVTDDDDEQLPLGESFVLENIVVLDKRELAVVRYFDNASNPGVGEPEIYAITMAQGAASKVHTSRLIPFVGRKLPRTERIENGGFHDSELTSSEPQLRRWSVLEQTLAHLVKELKLTAIKIDHGESASDDKEAGAKSAAKMSRINRYKSLLGMIVLGTSEDLQQVTIPMQGLRDLVEALAWGLSAALRMPLVKALGLSPAGLSADDEAGTRNWNDRVASYQRKHLTPALTRLHEALFAARNLDLIEPAGWKVSWPPIDEMTELERAELANTVSSVMTRMLEMGVPLGVLVEAMLQGGEWRAAAPAWMPDPEAGSTAQLNGAQAMSVLEAALRVEAGELDPEPAAQLVARIVGIDVEEAQGLVQSGAKGAIAKLYMLGNMSSDNLGLAA